MTLHPLPTHGGFMDSHVFRKASWRLPALADIAVLRFNLRGVSSPRGTSEGAFDSGDAERFDVAAAIELAEFRELPHRWLVGWSFGTDLALMHGATRRSRARSCCRRRCASPRRSTCTPGPSPATRCSRSSPSCDDYLQPDEARERFAAIPQARVVGVEGAKHLWVGEAAVRRVLDEIVAQVAPGVAVPLPTTWDGPFETHDDLRR